MFTLPVDTISGVLAYTSAFFNDIKIYIFLALGVAFGMLVVGYIITIVPAMSYKRQVRAEASRRIAEAEEEDDEFEADVEEES